MIVRPLSILLLYDCVYPESIGGVEHRNDRLARALAGRGHRITIAGFSAAPGPRRPTPGVEISPLGPPGRLYTAAGRRRASEALRLARAAASLDLAGFDVVETANIPYAHLPPLALRCRRAGTPLVVTWYEHWGRYWRDYLGSPLWPLHAAVEALCTRLGTAAIATSRLTAGRVAARRGEPVPVVPVGVPVAEIRAAASGVAETTEVAEAAGAGPPLVYAGRLLAEKRLDLLLAAVGRLAAGRAGPLLEVIGDGPDRARLAALAAGLGLGRSVVFAGRLPTSRDVWQRLGAARLAVQPSAREGFGLFPLEAMAAGLPVVVCESSESAVSELVRDGVEGVVTTPEPEALAAALARLLDDDAERARMAAAARRRAEGFDWSRVAERMEEVFQGVALDPSTRAPISSERNLES